MTAEEEQEPQIPLITHVKIILHSRLSNVEVYIKNQQFLNSNGLYAHKSYISSNFKGAFFEYQWVWHCEVHDDEEFLDEFMEASLSETSTRRKKVFSRHDGFLLYGRLEVDLLSISELIYSNMKIRLRIVRARPNVYVFSENPNLSLGIVDCSFHTRRIALKNNYHEKRLDTLACTPLEFKNVETFPKIFNIPATQNRFIQENILTYAPVRRIAIAMSTNSAFTGSYNEKHFWYQQFDFENFRRLRGCQPIVDIDAADNCRRNVTTMKVVNLRDAIPSLPIDNFKDHYVLVFEMTSMQDAAEKCHYPELVGEPLRLDLNFILL